MLKSLTLKFSENADIELPLKGITVFVGPNNSGKCLVLRESEQTFVIHPFPSGLNIVRDYEVEWPSAQDVKVELDRITTQDIGSALGQLTITKLNSKGSVENASFHEASLYNIIDAKSDKSWYVTQFLRWELLRLDGRSRFALTNETPAGDLLTPSTTVLQKLFQDDILKNRIRSLIFDAFGQYMVIDPTNLEVLRIRLSSQQPLIDEQSLNVVAREFYRDAINIKDASDGVQAYTGILISVMSGHYHTMLIDEPEAFFVSTSRTKTW